MQASLNIFFERRTNIWIKLMRGFELTGDNWLRKRCQCCCCCRQFSCRWTSRRRRRRRQVASVSVGEVVNDDGAVLGPILYFCHNCGNAEFYFDNILLCDFRPILPTHMLHICKFTKLLSCSWGDWCSRVRVFESRHQILDGLIRH